MAIIFHLNNEETEVHRAYSECTVEQRLPPWECLSEACVLSILPFCLRRSGHSVFNLVSGERGWHPLEAACLLCHVLGRQWEFAGKKPSRVSAALRGHPGWAEDSDTSVHDCQMRRSDKASSKNRIKGWGVLDRTVALMFWVFLNQKIKNFSWAQISIHKDCLQSILSHSEACLFVFVYA